METIALSTIAEITGGTLLGGDGLVSNISTDTRTLAHGDLFVALTGPNFDGNQFAGQALELGAVAALVSVRQEALPISQILVADTTQALADIAHWQRQRWAKPIVAITGSCGKTTVKGLVASILAQMGNTLATEGNLNNHIGVPKTLLRLNNEDFAVVEMGASAAGEIGALVKIAEPQVALVNNVVPAHLEGFGSVEVIAQTKGEIYQGLGEDGVAVVNLDDRFAGQWLSDLGETRWLGFSVRDAAADFYATHIAMGTAGQPEFDLCHNGNRTRIHLQLLGRANIANALAAAACASAVGASDQQIKAGLEQFSAVPGRLRVLPGIKGCRLIDDSYNANPGSVKAAIDVLADCRGHRILVLGQMGELGESAEASHREIGRFAKNAGIETLLTVGALTEESCREFGEGARRFENNQALADALTPEVSNNTVILVKGSRSAAMETVVRALHQEVQI